MRKLIPLFFATILTCTWYFINQKNQETQSMRPSQPLVDEKQAPADHFFIQRTYPEKTFAKKAFVEGMSAARMEQIQRSAPVGFDSDWVTQGPGNAGARVNDILVHPTDPTTIYLGYSAGGIFKTTNNGASWNPIFDDQSYLAIGDMEFDPNDPETIYVGTGDPSITGYPFIGNGIFKTTDGGQTWTSLGLDDVGIISKIVIDPTNPNVIYAGAMGTPHERNNRRGLYKSTNGGQDWTKVLFVDNETGVIDVMMHPANPDILFAGIWVRIRNNQESTLSSLGHKVYRSMDGGQSWQPLGNGLPIGTGGRVSLAPSIQNPNTFFVSFASDTHQFNGIYKTTNNGDTWTEAVPATTPGVSTSFFGFGWYLGRLKVNPINDNEMYVLGVPLVKTEDGGETWTQANPAFVHVDNHALVFDSNNNVVLGNDGGAYRYNRSTNAWTDIENIPATQVYRVAYNPFLPDTYYGGFQDNGTQSGSATTINSWQSIRGADGFQMAFNPDDSLNFYAETQNGGIGVTQDGNTFYSGTSGLPGSDRRNWDMPYFISPHESNTLYTGTYRVFKSTNRADDWSPISGDLTDGVVYGDQFHNISAIDESPVLGGLLYVGTSDGNVWRSVDDGDSWESLNIGLPDRYVTSIKASPDNENTVYVTMSGYRDGDYTSRVFRSLDKGDSWQSIGNGLPNLAANDILILPNHQDSILFVANDGGVYASLDAGEEWNRLGGNMPLVPVYDMVYNEARNQIVAGTYARSIMSFDLYEIGVFESVAITGTVRNWQNQLIPDVTINVSEGIENTKTTDIDGTYGFYQVPVNTESCEVTAEKAEGDIFNGFSLIDMLFLRRHLLFIDTLENYQHIAADVNGSETLSLIDLVYMRSVLLEIDTAFVVPFWRFAPALIDFADPYNPWPELEWAGNCSQLDMNTTMDFVGIRTGDLNGNADVNGLQAGDTRSAFSININDEILETGTDYTLSIPGDILEELIGLQIQLEFDPEALEYLETVAIDGDAHELEANFADNQQLTGRWNGIIGTLDFNHRTLEEDLFTIHFKVKKSGKLSDWLSLSTTYRQSGFADPDTEVNLELIFDQSTITENHIPADMDVHFLEKVVPNPAPFQFQVALNVATPTSAKLSLINIHGQKIWSSSNPLEIGSNKVNVNLTSQNIPTGVYWLEVVTEADRVVQQVVLGM